MGNPVLKLYSLWVALYLSERFPSSIEKLTIFYLQKIESLKRGVMILIIKDFTSTSMFFNTDGRIKDKG